MAATLTAPVPLSTPDAHILSEVEPTTVSGLADRLPDEDFVAKYEIERTLREIHENKWNRIALQFPDEMLVDSARIYQLLARGHRQTSPTRSPGIINTITVPDDEESMEVTAAELDKLAIHSDRGNHVPLKLTILADTSYGSCCVDEIAAEHVDAEAVIHYGRTCFSPTARLPVVHVCTKCALNHEDVKTSFTHTFQNKAEKILVMADAPYQHHVTTICSDLHDSGYENIFATDIVSNISSLIPNRTLPCEIASANDNDSAKVYLKEWTIFHISDPPTALLLTLESRVAAVHVLQVDAIGNVASPSTVQKNTAQVLRRRYALVTSLSTVSTWGVLINTLSVKNYLHIVDYVRKRIADTGNKSYLFVVGKLNPAKVANFAEIDGWVVIGCWESSLIDSRDFYRPIITPFELELVLQSDGERVWTGEWSSDFQSVLDTAVKSEIPPEVQDHHSMPGAFIDDDSQDEMMEEFAWSDEDAPPEFDLRTGKYVSRTKPMQARNLPRTENPSRPSVSMALTKRANGDMVSIKGSASPAAAFLKEKRTWQGLGSDFEIRYDDEEVAGEPIQEGRTGVAKGYNVAGSSRS